MRVITGSARGRRLGELNGMETRPTTDKVQESIFNCIQFDVENARVLDLFAGTGQLGIEALSRGAKSALFIDKRADAVKLVRENLALCRLEENAQVICGDSVASLGAQRQKFDIIFLDYILPEMNADRLLPVIKKLRPAAKVVVISGWNGSPVKKAAFMEKVDAWIDKPFSVETVLATMANLS